MDIQDFLNAKEKINEKFKKGQISKDQRSGALKKLREARSAARAGRLSKTPVGRFINYLTGSKPLSSIVDTTDNKRAASTRSAVSNLSTKKSRNSTTGSSQAKAAATGKAVKAMSKKDPRGNQIKPTPGVAKKKEPTKKFNVGVSKGGVSFKEAFKHFRGLGQSTFTWNGKKYTTNLKKAKPKASIKTPTPADFTAIGPKPTPKRKSKDKLDPRGNQIKAMSSLPAGALRKFQGSYDNKKEKLRNIGGKTYVVKR